MKNRKVTLLVLLLSIVVGGFIYLRREKLVGYVYTISLNFILLALISLVLFLYVRFKLNKSLFETIGIGDFLFFLILAISFPTYSFLILFSTSIIFSLVLSLFLSTTLRDGMIPLAGFQALFLSIILVVNSIFKIVNLYAY